MSGARPRRDLSLFRLVPRQADAIAPVVLCHGPDGAGRREGLAAFVGALLQRRVRCEGPPDEADVPVIVTVLSACWRCCRDVELAVGVTNVSMNTIERSVNRSRRRSNRRSSMTSLTVRGAKGVRSRWSGSSSPSQAMAR